MLKNRRLVIIVAFAIALIGFASWWTLSRITADVREEIGQSLTVVLETTHQALHSWAHEHHSEAQLWADSQEVLRLTKEFLDVEPTRETLINAPPQDEMRSFFLPLYSQRDHQGYCIIGPDNISLSSARDENIGVKNVLADQGDVLERIWSGETVMSLPLPSDVPLMGESGILIEEAPAMFSGAPIRDNTGEVIAILTVHIDPSYEFSTILKRGRLGESGETYAFDEHGRLISESRFDDQLREIGLIEPNEHGIFNVEIRDPGVNLVEGEQSIIASEDQPLTRMAESAVAGESGIDLEGYRDYRGVPVIGAWQWDEELDLGITIEVDVSDAYTTLTTIRTSVIALTIFSMLLMIGLATIFGIARQRLQENEERYRGIFEGVRDAILVESMTGEILDVNIQACELYGWSRDELLTKRGLDLVAEGHLAIVSGGLEGAELPPKPVETFNVRANGEHFPVEISARFHTIGDEKVMLVVVRDITERKQAEEQLKSYAAKLEQANEEVKQFAYIVSHDMRAPLVNLKGFATELRTALAVIGSAVISILPQLDAGLRKNVVAALEEDVPEALGFIDTAVTRMDHFINALLKLSRLGHRELQFEPVDTKAIVQATLETLAHTFEERQVEVIVGSLPEVIADMTSMGQIMANIISNAMKYLNPDRPGKIEITAERGEDEVTFMIHDNGRGIAKEDMDKVFAPFRRIGVQEVPGEGMGLPYVQALVRRHGGRILCESELGVGTTFSFTISNRLEKGVEDAENT